MADRICSECDQPVRCKGLCRAHYQRRWYEANREHALAYAKQRYDPESAKARHERLKDDPHYRAVRKAAYDRWRAEHPDRAQSATRRWREAHEAHVREVFRAWEDTNRDDRRLRKRGYDRARRAQTLGARVDYVEILAEHGMWCHLCDSEISTLADLHMDHVIPLILGGPHHPDNIRPAHALCNMRKGARLIA